MSNADEFHPYVLCRFGQSTLECALWIMPDSKKSLALFLTAEQAEAYRQSLTLGEDWRVVQPSERELIQVLKASFGSGIRQAVLDPNIESADRLFDLQHVLQEMGVLDV